MSDIQHKQVINCHGSLLVSYDIISYVTLFTRVRTHKVWIARSPKTGDERSTHLVIPAGHILTYRAYSFNPCVISLQVRHGCQTDMWGPGPEGCEHTLLHRAIDENNEPSACFLIRRWDMKLHLCLSRCFYAFTARIPLHLKHKYRVKKEKLLH